MNTIVTCILAGYLVVTTKRPLDTLGPSDNDAAVVFSAIQAYTLRMGAVVLHDNTESATLSGFSLFPALAELAIATKPGSDSYIELTKVLLKRMTDEKTLINKYKEAYEKIAEVPGIEWKLANKLYLEEGPSYNINEDLLAASKSMFKADIQHIAFESPTAAQEINKWVEEETNYRTKNLVSPDDVSVSTKALLVNSMYLKGQWQKPFNEELTTMEPFYNNDKTLQVPMMHQTALFKYIDDPMLNSWLLELPYEGGQAAMILILPKKPQDQAALQENLRNSNIIIRNAMNDVPEKLVALSVPKFKIDTTLDLATLLPKCGIKSTFKKGQASLSRLLNSTNPELVDFHVTKAIQNTIIDVHENGTEAVSASEATVDLEADTAEEAIIFRADRPFFFALYVNRTAFLVVGRYNGD